MLILSTSIRLNRLHDEVHHQTEQQHSPSKEIIDHLLMRAKYFRNALVLLYSSISIFAVAGIIGGLTSGLGDISMYITIALTIIGIFCLAAASIILIKESTLSLEIMKIHLKEID
jgi:hypothetical protein